MKLSKLVVCNLAFVISLTLAGLAIGNLDVTASPSPLGAPMSQIVQRTSIRVNLTQTLPEGVSQRMIDEGRAIFHDHGGCFRCHGKDGSGTFFGPALTSRQHLDLQTGNYQEILDLIRSGIPRPKRYLGAMPPLGGAQLSNDEVRAVGAFVYKLVHGS